MDHPGAEGGQEAGCIAPNGLGSNHCAGPSEAGLGGQDAPDGFCASGRNAYPPGAKAFFADGGRECEGENAVGLGENASSDVRECSSDGGGVWVRGCRMVGEQRNDIVHAGGMAAPS